MKIETRGRKRVHIEIPRGKFTTRTIMGHLNRRKSPPTYQTVLNFLARAQAEKKIKMLDEKVTLPAGQPLHVYVAMGRSAHKQPRKVVKAVKVTRNETPAITEEQLAAVA